MSKKHQEEEHGESAPMWIVSFADLVTLMLSFFVILAAGNNKSTGADPEFADLVAALKAAFSNVETTTEKSADPKADFKELVKKLSALQAPQVSGKRGDADAKGIHGRHFRVTRIREGLELAMGGPVFFEAFSAKPTEAGEQQLKEIVKILRGHRNVVEIRGHVGETPWPSDWNYDDIMRLAYDRADYVGRVLREEGIDPRAIRLVAVGPNEPLKNTGGGPGTTGANRRVEIIIRESLIDDYISETPAHGTLEPRTAMDTTSRPADGWKVDGPSAN
jgi:chemotaxis protein MotB